jgi:spermidine synthase
MVELVSEVADAARRHLHRAGGSIYERPGSEVVLDDARNFLRATDEHFDVIVADLFVPWRSGAGALFTLEHFRAARDHLAPGGLFCQWLPLYQLSEEEFAIVAATFLDVFPDAQLFRGDFYGRFPIAALIGPRDALATADAVGRAALALGEQGVDDRWVTSPAGVFALYVGPLGEALPMLRDAPRNTDDWPVIEFRAARTHAGAAGKLDPFVGLSWTAFGEQLQSAVARHAGRPDAAPGFVLPPALDSARRGGSALQRAGALYVAGREREAGKALAAAAKWLPDALVAGARPDPTAAELWWDVAE